jgi:hypothetical protein
MKRMLPLLFIIGFAISFLSSYAFSTLFRGNPSVALLIYTLALFVLYLLPIAGGFFLVILIPYGVRLHDSFTHLFEHSLELKEVGTVLWARVPVSIALNLAYFTATFFVPFSILAETVPLGKLVENVVPNYTFTDILASPLVIMFFVFSGSGGPATIYLIRYLRDVRGRDEIGGRTVTLLQVLCYISWLALALFFGAHIGFDAGKADLFLRAFLIFVLPATFANLVVFGLVRFVHASRYIS